MNFKLALVLLLVGIGIFTIGIVYLLMRGVERTRRLHNKPRTHSHDQPADFNDPRSYK